MLFDDGAENSSSKIAAGIINPVTGRRYVTTWMIEDLVDFAEILYKELGIYLKTPLHLKKNIIDFFPSAQMLNAFVDRSTGNDTYLHAYPNQNRFNEYFNYDFGCGEIKPAYWVNVPSLLSLWRKKLIEINALKDEAFLLHDLGVEKEKIKYQNVIAEKIVFCEGIAATKNPWFSMLPFSANKGEALIIECEGLPVEHIYKRSMMLAPMPGDNTFWFGSNYQWEFKDDLPSEIFYHQATGLLNSWLRKPYKVLGHKAAVRPSTLERRPFVGFHPQQPNVGILNGMGTKGTSLAPFFAHQLAQNIVYNFPISPGADINRFNRILSK